MEQPNEMHALIKKRGTNLLDDLTLGLVNSMKYSHADILYPEFTHVKSDQGVEAEWFYDIYRGTTDFSELNAINQYVSQEAMFPEIGELMLGIALVEMKHMDKLGDFILKLGGKVTQPYNTSCVSYGNSAAEAARLGIEAEKSTLREYNRLLKKVNALPSNPTTQVTAQLLTKLIADEILHVALFEQWLTQNKE